MEWEAIAHGTSELETVFPLREIRSSKHETRNKCKCSKFEYLNIVSDFGFRISSFPLLSSGGSAARTPSGRRPISTARLKPLRAVHLLPVNPVISRGAQRDLILGTASRLDAFSVYPHSTIATQQCPWQDNWYTRGRFFSVLSY